MSSVQRTLVYVDGFNLYFGLVDQGWRKYLWLNLNEFATSILRSGQQLLGVRYFTSRIDGPPDKVKRQNDYLTAIRTLPKLQIITGRYQSDPVMCNKCGIQVTCPTCRMGWLDMHEKMTDVNIATHLFVDAHRNLFDAAILVTGDADQRPAIKAVRDVFGKHVYVCFPPMRNSFDLRNVATDVFFATEEMYRKSQFPLVVQVGKKFTVTKPEKWVKNVSGRI